MAAKPYKASSMKAGDIHGDRQRPDTAGGVADFGPSAPSTTAPVANAKPSMIDGPYGGKKPVS